MNPMPAGEAKGSKGKENHFLGSGPLTPFPIAGTATGVAPLPARGLPNVGVLVANRPKIATPACAKTRPGADLAKGGIGSNKRCIFLNIELSQAEKLQHLMGR
jgi:hypothetical protein